MAARGEKSGRRPNAVAVDLGTVWTRIHVCGDGIVVREPTMVAVDRRRNAVLAIGEEARQMLGRSPEAIEPVRPVRRGVVAELEMVEVMLQRLVRRTQPRLKLIRPLGIVTVPSDLTEVERRAVRSATQRIGLRKALFIEEPIAAAIGAGLPVWTAQGSMVMNIGGGTCQVAVIAMNGIVAGRSLRVGGDDLDEAIVGYMHRELNFVIGRSTAEYLKHKIGSAYPLNGKEMKMVARGRDLLSGLPGGVEVDSLQIREAVRAPVGQMVEAVRQTLESTPPELSVDILERGLVMTGGGCLLRGLGRVIERETRMRVRMAENPLECTVVGAARALEERARFENALSE